MLTRDIEISQTVQVSVDESKFTPEFMAEFRQLMYHFITIDEHLEHLAQLYARGIYDENSFIEGYGPAKDFGIKLKVVSASEEIIR